MIKAINYLWKIYFFILSFISFYFLIKCDSLSLNDYIDTSMIIISLTGLFCFIFKKQFLPKHLWKTFFITLITWDFYHHFIIKQILYNQKFMFSEIIVMEAILAPMYLGLFIYAFIVE